VKGDERIRTAVTAPGADAVYERIRENLRFCRDGDRITIRGGLIRNRIQHDRCADCGMGLCDPLEYHPYLACEVFKRTHDSREVWRALRRGAVS